MHVNWHLLKKPTRRAMELSLVFSEPRQPQRKSTATTTRAQTNTKQLAKRLAEGVPPMLAGRPPAALKLADRRESMWCGRRKRSKGGAHCRRCTDSNWSGGWTFHPRRADSSGNVVNLGTRRRTYRQGSIEEGPKHNREKQSRRSRTRCPRKPRWSRL
jgi:hypothetical protein